MRTDREWQEFDRDNPHLWDALVEKAREIKVDAGKRGISKVGFRLIWELVRYEADFDTEGGGKFKMNNDYIASYARVIMSDPETTDLAGFFTIKARAGVDE